MTMWINIENCSSVRNHAQVIDACPLTLAAIYDYRPEDVVVLKDDPKLPGLLQPTRVNVVSEYRVTATL